MDSLVGWNDELAALAVDKPEAGEQITITPGVDQGIDISAIASLDAQFYQTGSNLWIVFEDGAVVIVEGYFDGGSEEFDGTPRSVIVDGETFTGEEFLTAFAIDDLPDEFAEGDVGAPDTQQNGASFDDPSLGPLGDDPNGIGLLDNTILPTSTNENSEESPAFEDTEPTIGAIETGALDEDALLGEESISITGALNVTFGANAEDLPDSGILQDAPSGPGNRSITFDAADATAAVPLESGGVPLTFALSEGDTVLTAFADGSPVFEVRLFDDGTGSYQFTLFESLDHPDATSEDDLELTFSFTATDSNGDTASGTFSVSVNDDVPVVDSDANARIVLDDDDVEGLDGNPGFGSDTTDGADSDNAPRNTEGTLDLSFGADGGSVRWDAENSQVNGRAPDVSFSEDNGDLIISQLQDDTLVEIARFTLDALTGEYVATQSNNLLHFDNGEDNENDQGFTLAYRVTDGDGDTADGFIKLTIDDDSPVVDSVQSTRVDEDGLADGTDFRPGSQDRNIDLAISWGADGAVGQRSLDFADSNGDAVADGSQVNSLASLGIIATHQGNSIETFTSDGVPVLFTISDNAEGGQTLLAYKEGTTGAEGHIFSVNLNTETTQYEFQLLGNLDHPADGNVPFSSLTSIVFTVGFIAEDGDGDTVSSGFEIELQDDQPEGTEPNNVRFDEDRLPDGGNDFEADQATAKTVQTQSLKIVWGADNDIVDENGDTFGRTLTFIAEGGQPLSAGDSYSQSQIDIRVAYSGGAPETSALSSGGAELVFKIEDLPNGGQLLTAYKDGGTPKADAVFKVTLDPTAENGAYTVEMIDSLDHGVPDAGSDRNNIQIDFGYQGFDADGDAIKGNLDGTLDFKITIDDDAPVIDINAIENGVVEEEQSQVAGSGIEDTQGTNDDDFRDGFLGWRFNDETTHEADGGLGINWGADDANPSAGFGANDRGVTFATSLEGATSLTSRGDAISYELSDDGTVLRATAGGRTVFTVALSDEDNGSYEFTLVDTLDHPSDAQGEDSLKLTFDFVATDSDGDTAEASFDVTVIDDQPITFGTILPRFVEEEGLSDGNQDGLDFGTSATGLLNIYWGGDDTDNADSNGSGTLVQDDPSVAGQRSVIFSDANNGPIDAADVAAFLSVTDDNGNAVSLSSLTSNGEALTFNLSNNGTILTAEADGQPVFTVTLSDDGNLIGSGSYTFSLLGTLDHPIAGNSAGDEDVLTFTFDFTASDGDGDIATGSFEVRIVDDSPVATGTATITVDEDDIVTFQSLGNEPFDGAGDGSTTGVFDFIAGPAFARGNLNDIVSFGADGPAQDSPFGFSNDASQRMESLGLTSKGQALSFTVVSVIGSVDVLVGYVDSNGNGSYNLFADRTVVSFTLDEESGEYQVRLFDQLDHENDGNNDENTALATTDQGVTLPGIDFGSAIEATDGDGDTILLDNGAVVVSVTDDVPAPEIEIVDYVRIDETFGNHSDNTNNASVKALFAGVSNPGDDDGFPDTIYARFDVVDVEENGGADDATSTLAFRVIDDDSGLKTTSGDDITLAVEGDLVVGRTASGDAVFAIHVDDDGDISIAQYVSLRHPDISSSDEHISLTDKLALVFTVTDGDGDVVEKVVPIGDNVITFDDDGPSIGNPRNRWIDEEGLGGNIDDPYPGDRPGSATTATGNLRIDWGADEENPTSGGGLGDRSVSFDASQPGLTGLTSNDSDILIEILADGTLVGYTGTTPTSIGDDGVVFHASLSDADSGSYEFTLLQNLDHPAPGVEDNLRLDFAFTATDADGDTDSDTFTVRVDDDAPIVDWTPQERTNNFRIISDDETVKDANGDPIGNAGGVQDSGEYHQSGKSLPIFFGADGGSVVWNAATSKVVDANKGTPGGISFEIVDDTDTSVLLIKQDQGDPNNLVTVAEVTLDKTNGDYSYKQVNNLLHQDLGDNIEDDATFELGFTVEDGDGDIVEDFIPLIIDDDTPVIGDTVAPAWFAQDFESASDAASAGLFDASNNWVGDVSVVPDGTNGINTPDGGNFAILTQGGASASERGPFTRFDGYKTDFQGGFTASVAIYLDTSWSAGEGFDYSVAATGQDGNHQRDFIFHVTKDTSTGKLLVGGSNNTNFDPREDLETLNNAEITSSGWYTFEHVFRDFGDGTLAVDLNVYDSSGTLVFTETRNDPSDLLSTEIGGNRYGWFTNIDVTGGIAVDDLTLSSDAGIAIVDEDDLAEGNNDVVAGDEVVVDSDTLVTGDLAIAWGADDADTATGARQDTPSGIGDRSVTFDDALDGAMPTGLTSDGEQITYEVVNGGTALIARADGRDVFVVGLNDDDSGSYTFRLLDNLDHSAIDTEDNIDLEFGFVATDSDGDTATGSFTVSVDDDTPVIDSPEPVTVSEAGTVSVSATAQSFTFDLDGTTYSFDIAAGRGDLFVSGGNLAGPTLSTYDLLVELAGGTVRASGNFSVDDPNPSIGVNLITQGAFQGQFQASIGGQNTGGNYQARFVDQADADAFATFAQELEGRGLLNEAFRDNGFVSATGNLDVSWGADDTDEGNNNFNQDAPRGTGDRSITFTDQTDASNNIVDSNGDPLALSSGGIPLEYSLNTNGTVLTATAGVGGAVIFTVALDDDDSGSYRFRQSGPLDHSAAGADELAIDFSFTATDSDGDADQGQFTVNVTDDVPTIQGTEDVRVDEAVLTSTVNEPDARVVGIAEFTGGGINGSPIRFSNSSGSGVQIDPVSGGWLYQLQNGTTEVLQFELRDNSGSLIASGQVNSETRLFVGLDPTTVANQTVRLYTSPDGVSFTFQGSDSFPALGTDTQDFDNWVDATLTDASGNLGINWGADDGDDPNDDFNQDSPDGLGDRSVVFGTFASGRPVFYEDNNTEFELTSGGQTLSYSTSDNGTVLYGFLDNGTSGGDYDESTDELIFKVTLDDDGTGAYRFELLGPLDHVKGRDDQDLEFFVSFTATDADGDTVDGSFEIIVDDDVPEAASETVTTNEDEAVAISVLENDSFGADRDASADAVVVETKPLNGTALVNADGTITYTPKANYNGSDSFTYTIKDGDGDTSTATVEINITPVPDTVFTENRDVVDLREYTDSDLTSDKFIDSGFLDALGGDDDVILPDAGDDLADKYGTAGTFDAGKGNDKVLGGNLDDTIKGNAGGDELDGGDGNDTVSYTGSNQGVRVNLQTGATSGGHADGDTISNFENVIGSSNDDVLTGNGNANKLNGGAGNDVLNGGGGNDTLDGGTGSDDLNGGSGNDRFLLDGDEIGTTIDGGNQTDTIELTSDITVRDFDPTAVERIQTNGFAINGEGGSGSDRTIDLRGLTSVNSNGNATTGVTVNAGNGKDTVFGTAQNDTLNGGNQDDVLNGEGGDDELNGGAGNDVLNGGGGNDTLDGGTGSDDLNGGSGNDRFLLDGDEIGTTIDGGNQTDTIELTSDITVRDFDPTAVERIQTNGFAINGEGGSGSDRTIDLRGLTSVNSNGNATTGVTVNAGNGKDTVFGTAQNDTLNGGNQDDVLNGEGGDDELNGGAGNDVLNGGGGNDTLDGGTGSDDLNGGSGNDRFLLDGDEIGTTIDGGNQTDTIELTSDITVRDFDPTAVERIQTNGFAINGEGGSGSDRTIDLRGLTSVNSNGNATTGVTVNAGNGKDTVFGTAQNDTLNGGNQDDVLNGEGGDDELNGGAGNDVLNGGGGNDTLDGGTGSDDLNGGSGNDRFLLDGDEIGTTIDGGNQTDTIELTSDITVRDFDPTAVERIQTNGFAINGEGGSGSDRTIDLRGLTSVNSNGNATTGVTVNAGNGKDTVFGTAQNDTLNGGNQDDVLNGEGGDDIIWGGTGIDTLTGGSGDDVFVIRDLANTDIITDFKQSDDKIDLTALLNSVKLDDPGVNAGDYVKVEGGIVKVDSNGAAGGDNFVDVAELSGFTGSSVTIIDNSDTSAVELSISVS